MKPLSTKNKMETGIFRFELEISKLILVDEIVRNYMKLESITNNFFNKFSQYI